MHDVAGIQELPVSAARTGDPDAWDTLFRRYQLPLFTFVMDLVRHEQTALDLVQDTFLAAVRNLGGLRDDSRFGSWLFGIAHQRVVQHWRRSGRSPFSDAPLPESEPDLEPAPDLRLVDEEDRATLLRAVDSLSPDHRSVVLLHYLEDFPLAEIATITGATLGTVKSRLHYARRELRRQLAPDSFLP
jgi:RNA polymerase sigma-70 factor (ECF subfamily)